MWGGGHATHKSGSVSPPPAMSGSWFQVSGCEENAMTALHLTQSPLSPDKFPACIYSITHVLPMVRFPAPVVLIPPPLPAQQVQVSELMADLSGTGVWTRSGGERTLRIILSPASVFIWALGGMQCGRYSQNGHTPESCKPSLRVRVIL